MSPNDSLAQIPVIRAGRPARSASTSVLAGVDGTPLATVHQAPPLLGRLTVAGARDAAESADTLLDPAIFRRAGELFATAELNGLGPKEYCDLQSRAAGVPITVARHSLDDMVHNFANAAPRAAAERPAGAAPGAEACGPGEVLPLWTRRGDVLAVVAPSNNPGTHTQWLVALACGYRLVIRPGSRDPLTPARMVAALLEAGIEPSALSLLPGGHELGDALVEAADLSMVFGGDQAARRYAHDRRVILRGPGRSKLLHSGELTEAVLDTVVASATHDAGLRCTCATAVFTDSDPRELAEALADRMAPLTAAPPQSDRAQLPVLPTAEAHAMRGSLAARLAGAEDVAAARYPDGPVAELGDGSAALRPAVLLCDRVDHPGSRIEMPFPCLWVLPWRRSDGLAPLGETLALTVLADDPALAREALRRPAIRKVLAGPVPTWAAGDTSPHDGFLSHELMEARAYGTS
ncbi:acyl-CoA reductase-like NAD-dependent aldehyde dehydrogenase [Catenulispora sp. MAP12-49]|uniref:aldehyde dehydrogenase family protein n=1 Tax=Catenulispora sp. MAP12-49 TaxID=3156302 RepID=UPI0035153565